MNFDAATQIDFPSALGLLGVALIFLAVTKPAYSKIPLDRHPISLLSLGMYFAMIGALRAVTLPFGTGPAISGIVTLTPVVIALIVEKVTNPRVDTTAETREAAAA